MIENVFYIDRLIAIILRSGFKKNGIHFFTPENFSQQLGYMNHIQGHVIEPHVHNQVIREIHYTNEVLFIKSGKVRADFYDDNQNYLESRILYKGDFVLLAFGGHGFEMLEPTEMIEIKQGPYSGELDKTRFDSINPQQIRLND